MSIRHHIPKEAEKQSIDSILWSLVVKNGYHDVAFALNSIKQELLSEPVEGFVNNYEESADVRMEE